MYGYIDGVDFCELPAEKYWSFPKSFKGNKEKETKYMIKSGLYKGSLKKDGFYERLIKDEDGNIILQGRSKSTTGVYLNKIDFVPQCREFFESLPNGTCLLGELYFPNKKGSRNVTTILGCLKNKALERQEKGEKLFYYVFDVWAYNGKSYLETKFDDRIEKLKSISKNNYNYIQFAEYFEGEILWNKLNEYLNNGEEGIVITKADSIPAPGKRTSRKTLKVKQTINETIDAFIDGTYKAAEKTYKGTTSLESYSFWINDRTGEISTKNKFKEYSCGEPWSPISRHFALGYAGSVRLSVMKDGKEIPIGYISGITDEMRDGIVNDPKKYYHKVYELSAMEIENINGNYSLRHGKIIQERPDKDYRDCDFSQICAN